MTEQRWLRIIPVALIMYTISYIDRTNVALALDPKLSSMMSDLLMDDKMKGHAAGIFFFGYILLQIPGGYLANRWSARKLVACFLVLWGATAVGCGLVQTFQQFSVVRFLLGVAESGVYPATLVLLANWFPRAERARANGYWNLCQPLAVVVSAPLSGFILDVWSRTAWAASTGWASWRVMLVVEGALPFLWLPVWLYFVSDHPRQAKWITPQERDFLERTLRAETAALTPPQPVPFWRALAQPALLVMVPIYFLQNCAAYGCNTFLTSSFDRPGAAFSGLEKGILFAIPYCVAAVTMVLNARHSDRTGERRGHAALAYVVSGTALIASVWTASHSFWLSYLFLCFAILGPFAGQAPFWAIPAETMPRAVLGAIIGLVNAVGNLGGYLGPFIVGALKKKTEGIVIPFTVLGAGLLTAAVLCFLLPRAAPRTAGGLAPRTAPES
jgi:MFS family permease